jgi:hypothetical protein
MDRYADCFLREDLQQIFDGHPPDDPAYILTHPDPLPTIVPPSAWVTRYAPICLSMAL